MRYAILSDIHGHREKLEAALADARARGADRIISLGDVGGDECLSLLREAGASAVFGNYEVSGWQARSGARRLAAHHRAWIYDWPPLWTEDGFLAVHAAPWWPQGLHTVEEFGAWLRETGQSWRTLFPYLDTEERVWQALAELEAAGKAILFHGHTHQQSIWHWKPGERLRQAPVGELDVVAGYRYVVGVGSVGLPEDGGWAAYGLFDTGHPTTLLERGIGKEDSGRGIGRIELIRLERRPS